MRLKREGKKVTKFHHALISVIIMVILIFSAVVGFGAEPQIPLIFGCFAAGIVAVWIGYSWEEILEGMISGITQSLEAILILMLIGMLVGTWIASGTVPTMIFYGLQLISARYFLFATALICLIVSFAIGAWGTVGTVGLAFMGIGLALGIPAPVVAGSIITGAYCGEIVSPLSDATNLTAAVVGRNVFDLMKRVMGIAMAAFVVAEIMYFVTGLQYGGGNSAEIAANIDPLLNSLKDTFTISPLALIPMVIMVICIIVKFPAIPSMLAGIISGMAVAMLMQGAALPNLITYSFSGFVSNTGMELLDTLLTAGGLFSMMNSISIVIIAMAFGGLMQHTGQMGALVAPIVKHIRGEGGLSALTVVSCIGMNVILPDQYLGISVPGQMYADEYDKRGFDRLNLSRTLLCGGAVTSPLIPWNTCGIYCMSILGVSALQYLPFAYFDLILPVMMIVFGFAVAAFSNKGRKKEKVVSAE